MEEVIGNAIKYGVKKGAIFYINDPIMQQTIDKIMIIISYFLKMTQGSFTKWRPGNYSYQKKNPSGFRGMKDSWEQILLREIGKRMEANTLEQTVVATFSNCSSQQLQQEQCFIVLSNKTRFTDISCQLYFQCDCAVSWSKIYAFLQHVNSLVDIQYASAGYEMAFNPYSLNAGLVGLRSLDKLKYVNSMETEWQYYLIKNINGVKIPCPNYIQLLSPIAFRGLELQMLENTSITATHTMQNEKLLIDILDRNGTELEEPAFAQLEKRFHALYQAIKPILQDYERPVYLKPDIWEKRVTRFEL